MAHKARYISILQFDEHRITCLQVRPSSKGVDVAAFHQERGAWSAQDGSLLAALSAFAETHGLAQDRVCTVLPRYEITTRVLKLPSHDPDEIAGMVRLGAEEFVPYPVAELVIDQCLLERMEDGHARVLAVFAHREGVEAHAALLKSAGIEPAQIFLSTACLSSASIAASPDVEGPYAVINLASGGLEAVVIHQGRLQYSRGVATVQDWEEAASPGSEASEELLLETRATLSGFRRESEDGKGVDHAFLCSDWAYPSEPAEVVRDATAVECAPALFAGKIVTRGADQVPSFPLVAIGAALAAQNRAPIRVDLIPHAERQARKRAALKSRLIRAGAMIGIVLAALAAYYAHAAYQRYAYIHYLNEQTASIAPRVEGVLEKQKQLRILQEQVARTGSVLELLGALCSVAPESGLNITRFTFRRGEGITVEGRAKKIGEYQEFVDQIRALGRTTFPQLARAQEGYTNFGSERGVNVTEFSIPIAMSEDEETDR